MKEPFQLRLPSSPSIETGPAPTNEPRLSPRPSEIRTLRAWRSDQNLMASSLETFGLLPSPPLSEFRTSQASPTSTYFTSTPGSELEKVGTAGECVCRTQVESCGQCTPRTPATDISVQGNAVGTTNVRMAHSNFVKQCELEASQFTPASTSSGCMSPPATCSDVDSVGKRNFSDSSAATQRSRSGTVSSEGSWVPSSLSCCEPWLQGAPTDSSGTQAGNSTISNRRKFQIVQKSPSIPDWNGAQNDAMLAVKSKTKPKLVDISRQSSPAMSYSLPTPNNVTPATPDQSLLEVSAFSPETPLESPDSGYAQQSSFHQSEGRGDNKDDVYTGSDPMNSRSTSEARVSEKAAEDDNRSKSTQKPPAPQIVPPTGPTDSSPAASSNKSEKDELEKWWDHEWTIDQLEQSTKDFPQNILRLTSPVIMFLRHNHERALLRPFRRIFPDAPESLLDSLCAVLVAKNYLLSLPSLSRRTVNLPAGLARSQLSKLDTVPEKASSILGMKFAHPPPSRIRDQVLGSRSGKLHQDLDRIVDNLLFTIHGPTDEALRSAVLALIQALEVKA
ncbi:hypothetical protein BJX61DRAFT_539032 [Aspergillus egyptiacus]|nr:hypothetical protein BJX61DRAFT_539032 [Aspergillus egyptiacus]